MLSHFSSAMSNKRSTVATIEDAISNIELDLSFPWIERELNLIEKNEMRNGVKRSCVSVSEVRVTTAQTIQPAVALSKKRQKK